MMNDCIEITAADNGYVLRYKDPELVERNANSEGWVDPYKSRVYNDPEQLTADLSKLLPLMLKYANERSESDEYKDALAEAFARSE